MCGPKKKEVVSRSYLDVINKREMGDFSIIAMSNTALFFPLVSVHMS